MPGLTPAKARAQLRRDQFAHIHPSVTPERVAEAVEREITTLDNPGFCLACGAVPHFKAMGLMSEIIAWRLRLFVPTAEDRGLAILGAILQRHPLLRANARAA